MEDCGGTPGDHSLEGHREGGRGRLKGRSGGLWAELVAGMDDERLHGPHVFTFSLTEAMDRGLLARFGIDVLEIHPPDPGAGGNEEEQQDRRLATLQAALVKHAVDTGTPSLISFHHRTMETMASARALPGTTARLHKADPARYPWQCGRTGPAASTNRTIARPCWAGSPTASTRTAGTPNRRCRPTPPSWTKAQGLFLKLGSGQPENRKRRRAGREAWRLPGPLVARW